VDRDFDSSPPPFPSDTISRGLIFLRRREKNPGVRTTREPTTNKMCGYPIVVWQKDGFEREGREKRFVVADAAAKKGASQKRTYATGKRPET
jgi:hypothetical protein